MVLPVGSEHHTSCDEFFRARKAVQKAPVAVDPSRHQEEEVHLPLPVPQSESLVDVSDQLEVAARWTTIVHGSNW